MGWLESCVLSPGDLLSSPQSPSPGEDEKSKQHWTRNWKVSEFQGQIWTLPYVWGHHLTFLNNHSVFTCKMELISGLPTSPEH